LTHRKAENTRLIERDWPHEVRIIIPGTGTGGRLLNEMETFCRSSGLDYRTQSDVRLGDLARMLWCFARPGDAAAFRERFTDHVDIVASARTQSD
jgi:hypothetical protein